ncbi:hypothetical protein D3C87_763210 [compost metagenome]
MYMSRTVPRPASSSLSNTPRMGDWEGARRSVPGAVRRVCQNPSSMAAATAAYKPREKVVNAACRARASSSMASTACQRLLARASHSAANGRLRAR